jgi:hypothetical protein
VSSTLLSSSQYVARSLAVAQPRVFRLVSRSRAGEDRIDQHTQVVIDGFQRSGNTFAYTAFDLAQDGEVTIAHHSHSAGLIRLAAASRIPTIVTLRNPRDVVVSHAQYYPEIAPWAALLSYVAFYQACRRVRSSVVVATFDDIIGDMGSVIRTTNERFGTDFRLFAHTEENVAECFRRIDHRAVTGPKADRFDMVVPRPNEARLAQREALSNSYDVLPGHLRSRAERLYDSLTAG